MNAILIFAGLLFVLFLVRNLIGLFWGAAIFFVSTFIFLEVGFEPAIPASVIVMYVATMLVAMLLYVTSSNSAQDAFFKPIKRIIVDDEKVRMRVFFLLLIPVIVAWQSYEMAKPSAVPPPKIRSVHPSPPNSISTQPPGQAEPHTLDLIRGHNPLRHLEEDDPEKFKEHIARGKVVYYQNCYYCHGDYMAADGHYANAVKPPPANFQDPGTIAMLQEAFIFWRIAKGGPGLPDAGTPWDSSMPVWEKMLSEEDMWNVTMFLYDYTGYRPRGAEQH